MRRSPKASGSWRANDTPSGGCHEEGAMSGELILIVEDQPLNRKLVRDVLQAKGYRTVETETAEEGLQVALDQRPALILMDIQLPGINGIEALRRLRADPSTSAIPIIAVTASAMQQNRQEILEAGFDGYQPKPINVAAFLNAVRETLDGLAGAGTG
jgi:two-component system, cell cycle response regulator DivK